MFETLKNFWNRFRLSILTLFLFLTWLFTVWQLDLIRDQFIHAAIFFAENGNPDPFGAAMWQASFGFPPFAWFGISFSLQTSFDLMYFCQAIVVFLLVVIIFYQLFKRRRQKTEDRAA